MRVSWRFLAERRGHCEIFTGPRHDERDGVAPVMPSQRHSQGRHRTDLRPVDRRDHIVVGEPGLCRGTATDDFRHARAAVRGRALDSEPCMSSRTSGDDVFSDGTHDVDRRGEIEDSRRLAARP